MKAALLTLIVLGFAIGGWYALGTDVFDEYKSLPSSCYEEEDLIKRVIPDKNYEYWSFNEGQFSKGTLHTVYSQGKRPTNVEIKDPGPGFFEGCLPAVCYKYIFYSYNGKPGYINTTKQFVSFLGTIDNVQEAVLLAKITLGLRASKTDKYTSSWTKKSDGFHVRLLHQYLCPEKQESVEVIIGPKGIISQKVLHVAKFGGCVVI